MALPLIGLVPYIVAFISGPLFNFLVSIGAKFGSKTVTMSFQYFATGALLIARAAFLVASITLMIYIYNLVSDVILLVENISSDSALYVPYKILESIGLIDAILTSFTIFSFLFTMILSVYITKFVEHSAKAISDELYKIGMLLQV